MSKLQEIYDGWKNHLVPNKQMNKIIIPIHKKRMEICRKCPHNSKNVNSLRTSLQPGEFCILCGCPLMVKTKSLKSSCPDNPERWGAEVIDNE